MLMEFNWLLSVFLWMFLCVHHVRGRTVVEGFDGGSATLPCTLQPNGVLTWHQGTIVILVKQADGSVIIGTGSYNGDVSLVNSVDLMINPLKWLRDGNAGAGDKTFECRYTGGGEGSQQIQLRLLAQITGVRIPEATSGIITVTAGISITLTCSVTGEPNPPPSYSWSVDGGTISGQTSSSYTFTPNKTMKTIKCTAINRYTNGSVLSEKDATASLNVQYLDPPKPVPPLIIIENDKATLQCSGEGNPTPSYRWWGPGLSEVSSTSANYTIENVHRSAAGDYNCSYSNTIGSHLITANLVVQYPPDVTVSYDLTTQTLTCRAEGVPAEYFSQWEHRLDGKLLQALGTELVGTNETFTIDLPGTLTYEDTGYYVCQVSNGIKSLQRDQVLVSPQCPAVFEDQFRRLMWTEGESPAISAPFYTYSNTPNVKVVWEKSGESTVLTSHLEETGPVRLMIQGQSVRIEGTVTVLTLRDVTIFDEGNYTVTVNNIINGVPLSDHISFSVYVTPPATSKPESTVNIGSAVGGGIAGLVVVVIIVTISVLLFRRSKMKPEEATRPPEVQTVAKFQNGRQEVGGVYQDLTINPDYEDITDIQSYATLGEKCREVSDYEQCDVPVNRTTHVLRDDVTNVPQCEDLSFSTQEAKSEYMCMDRNVENSKNADIENNNPSTGYYNL